MDENEAVLIGKKEVAAYLRVSERKVDEWRSRYPDMPIFCEGKGARICADRDQLGSWQRQLFGAKKPVKRKMNVF